MALSSSLQSDGLQKMIVESREGLAERGEKRGGQDKCHKEWNIKEKIFKGNFKDTCSVACEMNSSIFPPKNFSENLLYLVSAFEVMFAFSQMLLYKSQIQGEETGLQVTAGTKKSSLLFKLQMHKFPDSF